MPQVASVGFNGAVALQPRKDLGRSNQTPRRRASMGPWLCSHGREGGDWLVTAAFRLQWGRGFAATEGQRVRRLPLHESLLQWGRGFAATEGRRYARLPRWQRRFNGAVALQPRKDGPHASRPAGADASMGPWLCSHGRAPGGSDATRRIQSFNGAVALQPRKVCCGIGIRISSSSFNGAVALQPRKVAANTAAQTRRTPLQWGRGFAATEGSSKGENGEPLARSFNGAVALQPRKGTVGP